MQQLTVPPPLNRLRGQQRNAQLFAVVPFWWVWAWTLIAANNILTIKFIAVAVLGAAILGFASVTAKQLSNERVECHYPRHLIRVRLNRIDRAVFAVVWLYGFYFALAALSWTGLLWW